MQCDDSEGAWKVFKENALAAASSVAGIKQRKKKKTGSETSPSPLLIADGKPAFAGTCEHIGN